MGWKRVGLTGAGGLLIAAATLALLRWTLPKLGMAFALYDVRQARWPIALLFVGGMLIGIASMAARKNPLMIGIAGLLVAGPYLPLAFSLQLPSQYPGWFAELVIFTAGAEPLIVGGLLVGLAGWSAVSRAR